MAEPPPQDPRPLGWGAARRIDDRRLHVVLAAIVLAGLVTVALVERPQLAEERAELVGQEVEEVDEPAGGPGERDPLAALRETAQDEEDDEASGDADDEATGEATDAAASRALSEHGVSASHPEAVAVGMGVLEAGGNGVDAAVAVAYALGVVEPYGSGLGGGGALLVHEEGGEPAAYDYREVVPASGDRPAADIGVPGFAAGMEHVHERHGSLDRADLIDPAVRLAQDGFEVDATLAERLEGAAHRLPINQLPRLYPGGAALEEGEVLVQPELAEALAAVQAEGAEAIHGGELGEQIAAAVEEITLEDLADYEVAEPEPAVGTFGDHEVIGGGPPVSGATVVQQLQILEQAGIADLEPGTAEHHHVLAQSWRLALADRTEALADPDAVAVPLDALTSRDRAEEQADLIRDDGQVPLGPDDAPPSALDELGREPTDTTHVTVVDRDGTMVSMTNTLSNFFGSGLPVEGFFLNDQLKNFSSDPESVNVPEAGKRPRSFVAPMILARDDRPELGLGSPGGRRIPMMQAQTVLRWAAHGEDLEEAVAAPRVHLEDEDLELEASPDRQTRLALEERGYAVTDDVPTEEYFGAIQALLVDHDAGTVSGAADERRDGALDIGS